MFITYTHVDQIKSRAKKFQVQSYQNLRRHGHKTSRLHPDRSGRAKWMRTALGLRVNQTVNIWQENRAIDIQEIAGEELLDHVHETPIRNAAGSLRREPFNSWPMENTTRVQLTVDYFTQIYAPMNAQNYEDAEGGNWLLSHLFKMALQADLLFECTVLFVWSQLPPSRFGSSRDDHEKAIITARGDVIQKLHHRLTLPKLCADDVTIHTVLALMAADFHRSQDDHVELHREGLRRIVALRGGLTDSDIPPQTRYSITAVSTEMMCDYAIRRRNRSPKTNITPDTKLEYPTHPFPPMLSKALSTLPPGFSDMALKTLLSYQVIQLLHRMAKATDHGPTAFPKDTSIAVEMMRLSMEAKATDVEKAIVTLSFVFGRCLFDTSRRNDRVNSSTRTYRSMKESLTTLAGSIFSLTEVAGQDFVVWAVFLLASARDDYGLPGRVQHEILEQLWATVPTIQRLDSFKDMLRQYFWHENLEARANDLWKRMMTLELAPST